MVNIPLLNFDKLYYQKNFSYRKNRKLTILGWLTNRKISNSRDLYSVCAGTRLIANGPNHSPSLLLLLLLFGCIIIILVAMAMMTEMAKQM